jgi:1,4-dihydroxy-2-naphthoate octaprenyltransferase
MAHGTNNLLNDYTDYVRGVDKDNYFRAQYGPQPLEHGLLTKRQLLTYAAVTGLIAVAAGVILIWYRGGWTLVLMAMGAFFVLFYTWPLKYIGLGEIALMLVWGPLMVGGGYYVLTGAWDWNVALAGLSYSLGVAAALMGKHIDKLDMDAAKHVRTLPVLLGDRLARYTTLCFIALQFLLVVYLMVIVIVNSALSVWSDLQTMVSYGYDYQTHVLSRDNCAAAQTVVQDLGRDRQCETSLSYSSSEPWDVLLLETTL